jgi:hypothetical protein
LADLRDDILQACVGRERITWNGDVNTVCERTGRKEGKALLSLRCQYPPWMNTNSGEFVAALAK